jgi:hypothetical protein
LGYPWFDALSSLVAFSDFCAPLAGRWSHFGVAWMIASAACFAEPGASPRGDAENVGLTRHRFRIRVGFARWSGASLS